MMHTSDRRRRPAVRTNGIQARHRGGLVRRGALLVAAVGLFGTAAAAAPPAQRCQSSKLKLAGQYALCRFNADAQAVRAAQPADYAKCDAVLVDKFGAAEAKADGACPTQQDADGIRAQVVATTTALKQLQARWVDNGDGTVSDTRTGLMWEQKDASDGQPDGRNPHDADNVYSWAASGDAANGAAFTDFLAALNDGVGGAGSTTISGCFAGHCDWRLPTVVELSDIADRAAVGCGAGAACVGAAFMPNAAAFYWASTTDRDFVDAMGVQFFTGTPGVQGKWRKNYTRAVRGGPGAHAEP